MRLSILYNLDVQQEIHKALDLDSFEATLRRYIYGK